MPPPKVLALLLCDAAARDASGKITLYGIFDSVFTKDFPTIHAQLSIYWKCLISEPGRLSLGIDGPDGSLVYRAEHVELKPEGKEVTAQGVYTLLGTNFPSPGVYSVRLVYGDATEIARTSLHLLKQDSIH